jgi:hypothetical protein
MSAASPESMIIIKQGDPIAGVVKSVAGGSIQGRADGGIMSSYLPVSRKQRVVMRPGPRNGSVDFSRISGRSADGWGPHTSIDGFHARTGAGTIAEGSEYSERKCLIGVLVATAGMASVRQRIV